MIAITTRVELGQATAMTPASNAFISPLCVASMVFLPSCHLISGPLPIVGTEPRDRFRQMTGLRRSATEWNGSLPGAIIQTVLSTAVRNAIKQLKEFEMSGSRNVVLVHGGWADGSSWSAVIERLQKKGFNVTAPQFALATLSDDVARLREVLARQDGPTIVAGHSYGRQIMTALGKDAPNVAGLVYVAAFALDQGESLGAIFAQGPPTPATAHLDVDKQGYGWLPSDDFVNHFASEVDPVKATVMFAVQQPIAVSAFAEAMGEPAWKSF